MQSAQQHFDTKLVTNIPRYFSMRAILVTLCLQAHGWFLCWEATVSFSQSNFTDDDILEFDIIDTCKELIECYCYAFFMVLKLFKEVTHISLLEIDSGWWRMWWMKLTFCYLFFLCWQVKSAPFSLSENNLPHMLTIAIQWKMEMAEKHKNHAPLMSLMQGILT